MKQKTRVIKPGPEGGEWWRGTSVYQIYPRSFCDSDGDGTGDLRGIISKLDYIKETGFETVWLSPFFASPQRDFGYDISDYLTVAPEYGTVDDVYTLIEEIHRRNMYVIFDMVLNHTSNEHSWFKESCSSRENPKRDWYVWQDGKNKRFGRKRPPNNWKSQTGGSGWQWDRNTAQWYWAAFLPFQPDLNYRNPDVKNEIFGVLKFWLDKGVDGFRLDIIGSIFEDKEFRDSPFIWKLFPDENNDGMLFKSTCRTQNLPESIDFSRELRKLTDSYQNPPRFMVGETFGTPDTVARFCSNRGLHSAFAFKCASVPFTASAFRNLVLEYEEKFACPLLPVWAFSNHDRTRRISRLGENHAKARLNAAFQITARGIPFFYYGEEIGITDMKLKHRDSLDPVSFPFKRLPAPLFNLINRKVHGALNRDCVRTPMQWDDSENAGFCPPETEPWLPVNQTSAEKGINVRSAESDEGSILHCIRSFLKFRAASEAIRFGRMEIIPEQQLPETVLGFSRIADDNESVRVFLNFGNKPAELAVKEKEKILLSTELRPETRADSPEKLRLSAFEGVILG